MVPFDKLDIYIALGAAIVAMIVTATITAAFKDKLPSVTTLQEVATIFNTKGGIILVLLMMWGVTLSGTVAFGIWVIAKGIDPQHAVVLTILGMLVSQAFGNVNGSLFTMLKGEDPAPRAGTSSAVTTSRSSSATNTLTASGEEIGQ